MSSFWQCLQNAHLPGYCLCPGQYRLHKVRQTFYNNLALTKKSRYWGKRDTRLILPTNSSLSVTLDQDHLRSTTTSRADPTFKKDRLWLNGTEEEIKPGGRLATCIAELKARRRHIEDNDPNLPAVSFVLLDFYRFLTVVIDLKLCHSYLFSQQLSNSGRFGIFSIRICCSSCFFSSPL